MRSSIFTTPSFIRSAGLKEMESNTLAYSFLAHRFVWSYKKEKVRNEKEFTKYNESDGAVFKFYCPAVSYLINVE